MMQLLPGFQIANACFAVAPLGVLSKFGNFVGCKSLTRYLTQWFGIHARHDSPEPNT